MYDSQHPFHGAAEHPWNSPLTPPDPFDPRPDGELGMLGGTGPRPQDFPFSSQGRRKYYAAVRAVAQQQQQRHDMLGRERMRDEEAAALRAALLLLS